ncbi:TlpA family protein disulfide reductase [Candidatus Bipolaricaulota bacterium]
MQEQTNRLQRVSTYALLVVGIIGIGLLVYFVVDHLSVDAPAGLTEATSEDVSAAAPIPSSEGQSEVPVGNRIGQRAPDFQLRSLAGETVSLSGFLGKVVILDFWASWCGPCRLTMPGLEEIAQSLSPDVILLGVSLDRTEGNASNYLTTNSFDTMIALYESYASALAVFRAYGDGGIPKTYVIDREGVIRYVGHPGSLPRRTVEGLL